MRVTFAKRYDKRAFCTWEALLGKRRRVPGSLMPLPKAGLPHDLAQYVIEAATGCQHGFWGCVADGATFKSTGRKRTKPGRAVIAEHRAEVVASEHLADHHLFAWQCGERSIVSEALDRATAQWSALRAGERLAFVWPSPTGEVEAA
jgi:hypothetical protein